MRFDINEETGNPGDLSKLLEHLKGGRIRASPIVGSSEVCVFAAADVDGLCSARILSGLLKAESIRYELGTVRGYEELLAKLRVVPDSGAAILLNCGALIDLTEHSRRGVTLYVLDSHRPVHHRNFHAPGIFVFDDDLAHEEPPGSNLSASPIRKRQRGLEDEFDEEDPSFSEEEEDTPFREYYRSNYYTTPAALTMYQLALATQKHSEYYLWLACVGLTFYYENGLLNETDFLALAHDLDQKYMAEWADEDDSKRKGSITFQEELGLALYRHCSLHQAVSHSAYVFGKLELNRDTGKRQLQQLLALAGIPPDEYNQMFASMTLPMRAKLRGGSSSRFAAACRAFGLDEVNHHEFSRSTRLGDEENPSLMVHELCASDLVHAVTCALEDLGSASGAFDMLSGEGSASELRKGIVQALDWRKAVCAQVKMILDRRSGRIRDNIRFIRIERPVNIIFGTSVPALRQLGRYLATVYKHRGGSDRYRRIPLIMAVRNSTLGRYICVGINQEELRSDFHQRFKTANQLSGVRVDFDSLDPSVVEVGAADFDKWVQALFALRDQDTLDGEFDSEESQDEPEASGRLNEEHIPEFDGV